MLTIIIQMMKIIFGGGFKSGGAKENALSFKTLFWLINWKKLIQPKTSSYEPLYNKRPKKRFFSAENINLRKQSPKSKFSVQFQRESGGDSGHTNATYCILYTVFAWHSMIFEYAVYFSSLQSMTRGSYRPW